MPKETRLRSHPAVRGSNLPVFNRDCSSVAAVLLGRAGGHPGAPVTSSRVNVAVGRCQHQTAEVRAQRSLKRWSPFAQSLRTGSWLGDISVATLPGPPGPRRMAGPGGKD
jgi:hypothetical protein